MTWSQNLFGGGVVDFVKIPANSCIRDWILARTGIVVPSLSGAITETKTKALQSACFISLEILKTTEISVLEGKVS